jgi:hypothetical protein
MGQQQAQTNNNIMSNKLSLQHPQMKISYIPLQREDPLSSTADAKNPNTIYKTQSKQNLAMYI